MDGDRPVVLFDGRCGFCTWSVEFAKKTVRADVEFVPYQSVDVTVYGLTPSSAPRRSSSSTAEARAPVNSPLPRFSGPDEGYGNRSASLSVAHLFAPSRAPCIDSWPGIVAGCGVLSRRSVDRDRKVER